MKKSQSILIIKLPLLLSIDIKFSKKIPIFSLIKNIPHSYTLQDVKVTYIELDTLGFLQQLFYTYNV